MIGLNKQDWELIKTALQEKMVQSTDEAVDAQIAIVLASVEGRIADLSKPKADVYSRPECIFTYCPNESECKKHGCQHHAELN